MTDKILVTGATGVMGRDLVPMLHARSDADLVLMVHRKGAEKDPGPFVRSHFGLEPDARIRVVRGDVSQPGLGLEKSVRARLGGSVTHILHSAADTRFDQPLETIRRINLDGTRNVIEFGLAAPRLRQFGHISTAYVSGKREGTILESELDHDAGFLSTYEQSKYEAEQFIRSVSDDLPIAIYRPSIILGDSRTGVVNKMDVPHQAIRMMYNGLARFFPGTPGYPINFIPNDYAAATICRLFLEDFQPGCTYHVAASDDKVLTLQEFIHEVFHSFERTHPSWILRDVVKPIISSRKVNDLLSKASDSRYGAYLSSVLNSMSQLNYPKTFDRRNVTAAIPEYDLNLPDPRDYVRKVVSYCLMTRWGHAAA